MASREAVAQYKPELNHDSNAKEEMTYHMSPDVPSSGPGIYCYLLFLRNPANDLYCSTKSFKCIIWRNIKMKDD